MTTTLYGSEFVSGIKHKNIYATQFHPEKSHSNGIRLLKILLISDVETKNHTCSTCPK